MVEQNSVSIRPFRLALWHGALRAPTSKRAPSGEIRQWLDFGPNMFTAGDLDGLVSVLTENIGQPADDFTVVALLESQGWTDLDAQQRFGCPDLVSLGNLVWDASKARPDKNVCAAPVQIVDRPESRPLPLQSPYLLALVILQLTSYALGRFSFGATMGLLLADALAIGLGLMFGLVLANGFGQLLARDPLRFFLAGHDVLAGAAAFRVIGLTLLVGLGMSCLGSPLLRVLGVSSQGVLLGASYFLLAALFWVLVNSLFVLGLPRLVLVDAVLALTVTAIAQAHQVLPLKSALQPGLGLVLADLFFVITLCCWWIVRRRRSQTVGRLPRLVGVMVNQWGYVAYGLGLMFLIILDHLVAWRRAGGSLVLIGRYEIGLAWVFLAFLVMTAFQEGILRRLLAILYRGQHDFAFDELVQYGHHLMRAYGRCVLMVAGLTLATGLLFFQLVVFGRGFVPLSLRALIPHETAMTVFGWGLVGYGLLALAMFNSSLVISFSQPRRLLRPLGAGIMVGGVAAVALSSVWGYTSSIHGLVAGAGVLLAGSTWQVSRLLSEAAHELFAGGQINW